MFLSKNSYWPNFCKKDQFMGQRMAIIPFFTGFSYSFHTDTLKNLFWPKLRQFKLKSEQKRVNFLLTSWQTFLMCFLNLKFIPWFSRIWLWCWVFSASILPKVNDINHGWLSSDCPKTNCWAIFYQIWSYFNIFTNCIWKNIK